MATRRRPFAALLATPTFRRREDLFLLAVAGEIETGGYEMAWLVPSGDILDRVRASARSRLRFSASMESGTNDQWMPHRLSRTELPKRILATLEGMKRTNSRD